MITTDISYLFNKAELTEQFTLHIKPQGLISMCNDPGGKYYRTRVTPPDNMLYGMIENIMNIHIDDPVERNSICKTLKLDNKPSYKSLKAYKPIISGHLKIDKIKVPNFHIYVDHMSTHQSRTDSLKIHLSGCKNQDGSLSEEDIQYMKTATKANLKSNHTFPLFYTSIKQREYVKYDDVIVCHLTASKEFYKAFIEQLKVKSTAFLGTSEGIVDIKIV